MKLNDLILTVTGLGFVIALTILVFFVAWLTSELIDEINSKR